MATCKQRVTLERNRNKVLHLVLTEATVWPFFAERKTINLERSGIFVRAGCSGCAAKKFGAGIGCTCAIRRSVDIKVCSSRNAAGRCIRKQAVYHSLLPRIAGIENTADISIPVEELI